jgi:hypothetical protein
MRLAYLLLLSAGCSVTDFDITQPVFEQRVMGTPLPGPLATLFPLELDLDISQKIKAQETGPIDSVTLSSLELKITDTDRPAGDEDDWAFVEEVHVFVSSTKSGSTLPEVEIASASSPGAVTTFRFDVDGGVNLKPYIDEGSAVRSTASGTAPPDDVSFDGAAVFTVHPL